MIFTLPMHMQNLFFYDLTLFFPNVSVYAKMFSQLFVQKLVAAFYYWYHLNMYYLQNEPREVLYSKGREFATNFSLMTNREKDRYIEQLQGEFNAIFYSPLPAIEPSDEYFWNTEEEEYLMSL